MYIRSNIHVYICTCAVYGNMQVDYKCETCESYIDERKIAVGLYLSSLILPQ